MRDIIELAVAQIRIYASDVLPFLSVHSAPGARRIQEAFQFRNVDADPLGRHVRFGYGVFEYEGRSVNVIDLLIDPRRIQFQIRGSSLIADAFCLAVLRLFVPIGDIAEPLMKSDETNCVAILDIDFTDLVSPALMNFAMHDAKDKLRTAYGKPKAIGFRSLSFEIKYQPFNSELEEHGIALANKTLTIEPRTGTSLRERRFYTTSPTDSDTHLELLKRLEERFRPQT